MRLIPRRFPPKRLLAAGLLILAGCGGSRTANAPPQRVAGTGFAFRAPAGWQVQRGHHLVLAKRDSELVQVSTFPLQRLYTPALFGKVTKELSARVSQVAAQTGGSVTGRSVVTAAGIRSHRYLVTVGDHVDEYTFVLRGKREYLLLCRRRTSHDQAPCDQLIRSFALAGRAA
jgi:hypothetical protein